IEMFELGYGRLAQAVGLHLLGGSLECVGHVKPFSYEEDPCIVMPTVPSVAFFPRIRIFCMTIRILFLVSVENM
ncbi:MAG: hypothetical protein MR429_04735, partial [Bifidobacterium animalis]|nr:hypothetical protein [Bifidobacterium animalis]